MKKKINENLKRDISESKSYDLTGISQNDSKYKRTVEQMDLAKFPGENPFPILRISKDGVILYSNLPGYVLLEQWDSKIGHNAPADWCELVSKALKTKHYLVKEARCGKRIFSFAIVPITDGGYINLYGRDITALKRAEEALRKSENKYRTIADNTYDWEFWSDPDGRFVYCSPSCERITGHKDKEFLSDPELRYRIIHPDDRPLFENHRHKVEGKRIIGTGEWRIVRPDGTCCWVAHACQPVFSDKGEYLGIRGSNRDITERKEAESTLLKEKKFSDAIIDSLPGVFYLFNKEGKFLRWNKNFEQVLGYTAEEMSKAHPIELLAGDEKHLFAEKIQEVFVKGKTSVEANLISKNGFATLYFFTGNRIIFEQMQCVVGMGVDISERKKMEEEIRRSRDNLEIRVRERTAELDQTISMLKNEMQQRIHTEEVVKAERKRFNDVLEMMPAYAALLTPDYHVTYANRFFEERFGQDKGRRCYEYLFNRTEPCEICETYKVLKTGKHHHWEWLGPDGRNYDIFDYPFADVDGSPLIMEIGVDVTEHKQAQDALRSISLYSRGLIEASLDPLVTISQEGKITDVNKATELVTGFLREDLIGTDFSDYFTEPEKAREGYKKVLFEGFVRDYPLTIKHVSGHTTDVLYNAVVYKNEVGQIQGVFAAARDITQSKRQQQALQLSESRLSEAQRIARLGNWDWDIANSRLWWSDEVYNIFGLKPQQFGATYEAFLSCVHPDDRKYVEQSVNETLVDGKSYDVEHRIIKADGTERFVQEQAEVTYDSNGRPVRMRGTVQDITARKKGLEELRRSQEKLRSLAAELQLTEERERKKIAGDLHDSIGQILAFSSRELMTLQKSSPQKIAKSLKEIAYQLDEAVKQVRTLSFDLSPNILYDLGFEVAIEDLVEKFLKQRKIECHFENCPASKPLKDHVKILLYRSVRELLINIAKHANADTAGVTLRRIGNDIHITVEDTGSGFDVAQVDGGTGNLKGFGIFSIRERLEHIGGRVEIESTRDRGTKVTLIAPLSIS